MAVCGLRIQHPVQAGYFCVCELKLPVPQSVILEIRLNMSRDLYEIVISAEQVPSPC